MQFETILIKAEDAGGRLVPWDKAQRFQYHIMWLTAVTLAKNALSRWHLFISNTEDLGLFGLSTNQYPLPYLVNESERYTMLRT